MILKINIISQEIILIGVPEITSWKYFSKSKRIGVTGNFIFGMQYIPLDTTKEYEPLFTVSTRDNKLHFLEKEFYEIQEITKGHLIEKVKEAEFKQGLILTNPYGESEPEITESDTNSKAYAEQLNRRILWEEAEKKVIPYQYIALIIKK